MNSLAEVAACKVPQLPMTSAASRAQARSQATTASLHGRLTAWRSDRRETLLQGPGETPTSEILLNSQELLCLEVYDAIPETKPSLRQGRASVKAFHVCVHTEPGYKLARCADFKRAADSWSPRGSQRASEVRRIALRELQAKSSDRTHVIGGSGSNLLSSCCIAAVREESKFPKSFLPAQQWRTANVEALVIFPQPQ